MKFIGHAIDNQCVARIVAPLETRDDICALAQPINNFAFAFIATLSGKANSDRRGVFFCYRIPGPPPLTEKEIESGEIVKWVTEDGIGDSRIKR